MSETFLSGISLIAGLYFEEVEPDAVRRTKPCRLSPVRLTANRARAAIDRHGQTQCLVESAGGRSFCRDGLEQGRRARPSFAGQPAATAASAAVGRGWPLRWGRRW